MIITKIKMNWAATGHRRVERTSEGSTRLRGGDVFVCKIEWEPPRARTPRPAAVPDAGERASHGRTGCGRPARQVGQSGSQPRHRDPSPGDIAKKSSLIVWGAAGRSGVRRLAAFLSADPVITAADRLFRSILICRSSGTERGGKKKNSFVNFILCARRDRTDDVKVS